jgi:hypothetical protein
MTTNYQTVVEVNPNGIHHSVVFALCQLHHYRIHCSIIYVHYLDKNINIPRLTLYQSSIR